MPRTSRAPVVAFLGAVALAVAGLVVAALLDQRVLAFTLGVQPQRQAAVVKDGAELCQGPIDVSSPFDALQLDASTPGRAPGPVLVTIRAVPGGRVLRSARLPAGYLAPATDTVRLQRLSEGRRIAVCLRSLGDEELEVAGDNTLASRTSDLRVGGQRQDRDMALVFLRDRPASVLSLLPTIAERVSRFRPGWTGPWTFWALLGLVVLAVPALLARALALADRDRVAEERRETGDQVRPPGQPRSST